MYYYTLSITPDGIQEVIDDLTQRINTFSKKRKPFRIVAQEEQLDVETLLDDTIKADDREWRRLTGIVEAALDMPSVVEDYFLGVSASEIVDGIEGGGYHGKAD